MNITACKRCNSNNLKLEKTPYSVHYAKYICGNCGAFSHWVKNPENFIKNSNRNNKKTVREVSEFHQINIDCCFFCLRKREELGKSETLTIDHIIELAQGGDDQIWNMQILCSACHKLKNWARLYINWHIIGSE